MDRQTLNVAFATQKGGIGKTALTVLVAGYLHYRLGYPLAGLTATSRSTACTRCESVTAGLYWRTNT